MFILFSLIIIAGLAAIDQYTKFLAVTKLKDIGSMPFIHFGDFRVMDLTYLENDGALFGSFGGRRLLLIIITALLVLACFVIYVRTHGRSRALSTGLILVCGGGIGNLIDRIFRHGMVIDYFDIKLFRFAIFNFADCCVTIGIALILIFILFIDRKSTGVRMTKSNKKLTSREEKEYLAGPEDR